MKPETYVDFEAIPMDEAPAYEMLGKAVKVLHGVFAGQANKYAIAFPNARMGKGRTTGVVVRVFASSLVDLYALMELVSENRMMRDYMRMTIPRKVPDNFSGQWEAWVRVRVQKKEGVNRDKTLRIAQSTPFFEMASTGNGGVFPLRIKRVHGTRQTTECTPNSYGLASMGNKIKEGENMFYVPSL